MRISTSLNLYTRFIEKNRFDYESIMDRAIGCGFRCFDFNAIDYDSIESFYTVGNWRDNIKKIGEYALKRDVEFYQSHAAVVPDVSPENHAKLLKSIEATALVGAKWIAFHPWTFSGEDIEEQIAKNYEMIRPYAEFAGKHNVGLAIENGGKWCYWYGENIAENSAFYNSDDLIPLVDQLNEEFGNVGICWDTGHANLSMENQYEDLMKIGHRLKITHIADNNKQYDDHMAPFYGNTDFGQIMKALKEIEYQGTFNFETHFFTNRLPDELVDDGVKLLYKIGEYICDNE